MGCLYELKNRGRVEYSCKAKSSALEINGCLSLGSTSVE